MALTNSRPAQILTAAPCEGRPLFRAPSLVESTKPLLNIPLRLTALWIICFFRYWFDLRYLIVKVPQKIDGYDRHASTLVSPGEENN